MYRVDAKGAVTLVATEQQVPDPNGLAFSPDHKKLYVVSTGKGPGDTGPGGQGVVFEFDVTAGNTLANGKRFADFMIDGVKCGPDGVRCDVDGNLWCSSNAGRAVGYSGVTVWTPQGKLIGRIRLPEVCGNLCFGGPKRNRLFMAASQSLYAVYVNTQGRGRARAGSAWHDYSDQVANTASIVSARRRPARQRTPAWWRYCSSNSSGSSAPNWLSIQECSVGEAPERHRVTARLGDAYARRRRGRPLAACRGVTAVVPGDVADAHVHLADVDEQAEVGQPPHVAARLASLGRPVAVTCICRPTPSIGTPCAFRPFTRS